MPKLSRQEAARKAGEASARRSYEEKSSAAKKGWQTRRSNKKK